ncbi:methyltransferase type 11 [Rhodospirillum rubrum]|uniref:class I SAM-dependent methyltransferase n=1 Tax=Rhodospirillum rubrum TaxID=1085 RepID=UPI001907F02F|nr:methyltransferase domain-containing protein [Rhodospirillum rubrum]MBK1665533.1 methyltransferase type 11 [Rhodospirillum rubrum]MBK1678207.1 methyltransferase type 11 [Rhodospirillum rubrum]
MIGPMWSDVIDLRDFYATSQGQLTRRLIGRSLRALWPEVRGCRVLGLGYAVPFLQPFSDEAERVVAMMPAPMGAVRWPSDGPVQGALADELELPLPDRSIDRLLLIHGLEFADHAHGLLRECWRVLADNGRLMVVVPNRRATWARMERSPFANGQPYSEGQLTRLLRDRLFTPIASSTALFMPPSRSRMMMGSASLLEQVGCRLFPAFGGVVVVDCAKQIAAPVLRSAVASRRVYVGVGLSQPLQGSSRAGFKNSAPFTGVDGS